jgi:hypothetical protein
MHHIGVFINLSCSGMLWENNAKAFPPKTVLIVPKKTSPHRVSVVGVLFWVPCLWKSIPGTRVKWRVLKREVNACLLLLLSVKQMKGMVHG